MLVLFECKHYSKIPMFYDVAESLLKMMHHSGQIPGALAPEDLSMALCHLKASVQNHEPLPSSGDSVSMKQRAIPLISMLEHANKNKYPVVWSVI